WRTCSSKPRERLPQRKSRTVFQTGRESANRNKRPVSTNREEGHSPARARPRRSGCAPMAMAISFYRRPVSDWRTIMRFFSWLRNPTSTHAPRGPGQQRPAARRFRPRLEVLEGREVPSTLKVTSLGDSEKGSLRYEIAQAHSNDTIVFDFGSK